MEKTIKKRIGNLLTRIGDEGPLYYNRDIEKLNTLTPSFLSDEEKRRYFLEKFRICLNKIPFKNFVYAIYFTNQLQNYEKQMEKILDELFEDLQHTINLKKIIESENIMLFFGELVKIGVMNSFTYISLLMDLVSSSEKYPENFSFLINIVLKAITLVEDYLLTKFEMEFKNLVEDLERIFNKFLNEKVILKSSWEYKFFLAMKNRDVSKKQELFSLNCEECLNSIKHVKNIRKNFKLKIEIINLGENPHNYLFDIKRVSFFKKIIHNKLQNTDFVNEFIIYDFLWKNFLAFHKNIILFLEKIFVIKFEKFNSVKDFLLLELIFSILLNSYKLENVLLPALIIEKLIIFFNFDVFLNDCWKNFKIYFYENLNKFSFVQINCIIKNITFLNFITNYKIFNLDFPNSEINTNFEIKKYVENYFEFENSIFFVNSENYNNSQKKIFEQFHNKNYEYKLEHEYILQFIKSNHSSDFFFDFLKQIIFISKKKKNLPKIFLRAFLEQSSISLTHFKNYVKNYKNILEYFFINKENLLLNIFFELIEKKNIFFVKAINIIFFKLNLETKNILDFLVNKIFSDDVELDRNIVNILMDISNEHFLIQRNYPNFITEKINKRYEVVDKGNLLWKKYYEAFQFK